MGAEFGFVPLPDEDTEAHRVFGQCEECGVMTCRGDAPDPYAAADMHTNEARRPGHSARYAALALWGRRGDRRR